MVLLGPGCKLVWCEPLEARVRSASVVVVSPLGEGRAGVAERAEQGLVQKFVPQPAIDAFHERIRYGLAGLDVVQATPASCCQRMIAIDVNSGPCR